MFCGVFCGVQGAIAPIVGDVPPQSRRRRTRLRFRHRGDGHLSTVYVFVLLDIGTRRIVHCNLTEHPTAELTIQQFRNGLPLDGTYRFLVHDRGGIFAPAVDAALRSMSLQVLKTPVRVPQTNDSDRTSLTSRSSCRCSATPRRPASSLPAGTGRRVNFAEHSSADVYIWVESATEHVIRKAVLPPQQS